MSYNKASIPCLSLLFKLFCHCWVLFKSEGNLVLFGDTRAVELLFVPPLTERKVVPGKQRWESWCWGVCNGLWKHWKGSSCKSWFQTPICHRCWEESCDWECLVEDMDIGDDWFCTKSESWCCGVCNGLWKHGNGLSSDFRYQFVMDVGNTMDT